LSALCLEDVRFARIVNTKVYEVQKTKLNKKYQWENTHKMLGQPGVTSIKTGIT
jgi:hypothetical protein